MSLGAAHLPAAHPPSILLSRTYQSLANRRLQLSWVW